MTHDHEDPQFDRWLEKVARTAYNAPRATPREAMWERIEHARRQKRVIELRPWARWALAAAAVLLVGIGIGRWTADRTGSSAATPVAAASDSARSDIVYQVAATQYLSRAEAFLTGFRSDSRGVSTSGRHTQERLVRQARDLLNTTQLLLDSPAGNDPRMRGLLEDLELLLAQISQLGAGQGPHDADLVTQSMDQSNVLPKLRSAIPAGPVPVRTEGAL
jgi:hypothetical protein